MRKTKIRESRWFIFILLALLGVILMSGAFGNKSPTKANETEKKIKELCERVEGVGETTVVVTLFEDGDAREIRGIGIVCEGGEDPFVKKELLDLVSASCAVPSSRIYITGAKKVLAPQS